MADTTYPIVRTPESGETRELDPSSGDTLSVGRVDANYFPIVNVGSPVGPNDAATKYYVDSVAGGGTPITIHNQLTGRSTADDLPPGNWSMGSVSPTV